jgi:hypothetical protein
MAPEYDASRSGTLRKSERRVPAAGRRRLGAELGRGSRAAELGARIEAAEPVLVPRAQLEGRCGLEDRELWQLGVRTAPAGALSTGGGVLLC